ncbi:uncharacterized protein RJT21DRAFT_117391 [Scheffersomyces amazonensis]|uniref:uncharacterized protein n=1 Tax=Scheffersomyces amazonensis TaxID=1078765 RepID=UPI00315C6C19
MSRPLHIILLDINTNIYKYWNISHKQLTNIISKYGLTNHYPYQLTMECSTIAKLISTANHPNYDESGNTAVVSPTNSLSYMGGGYDKFLLQALMLPTSTNGLDYKPLESKIQEHSLNKFSGYLSVGTIHNINLSDTLDVNKFKNKLAYQNWKVTNLIQIPSMMVPESLNHSSQHIQKLIGVFDCVWNLLILLHESHNSHIANVIIPGIGSGYGELSEQEIGKIMIFAILLYNLNLGHGDRLLHLKKSCMILFFFRKNYRKLSNVYDLEELERDVITEYGKKIMIENSEHDNNEHNDKDDFNEHFTMEFEELFQCINLQ